MTINQRIRKFRRSLSLSQEEFSQRLGLTQSALSRIEKMGGPVTEQNILLLCTTFGVSEEWLRNGSGDMYTKKTRDEVLKIWAEKLSAEMDNSFPRRFALALSRLSTEQWEVLESIVYEMVSDEIEIRDKENFEAMKRARIAEYEKRKSLYEKKKTL